MAIKTAFIVQHRSTKMFLCLRPKRRWVWKREDAHEFEDEQRARSNVPPATGREKVWITPVKAQEDAE